MIELDELMPAPGCFSVVLADAGITGVAQAFQPARPPWQYGGRGRVHGTFEYRVSCRLYLPRYLSGQNPQTCMFAPHGGRAKRIGLPSGLSRQRALQKQCIMNTGDPAGQTVRASAQLAGKP